MDDHNYLVFLPFALSNGAIEVTEHTALNRGINYQVKGLRVVNGADTWEKGSTTYSYDTIQINSDLATEDTAEYIWENMVNAVLNSVKCQTAMIPYIPVIGTVAKFAQDDTEEYRLTSIRATFSGGYIKAELSAAAPTSSEISQRAKLARVLDSKVSLNTQNGCMIHTAYQGVILVDSKEVKNSG